MKFKIKWWDGKIYWTTAYSRRQAVSNVWYRARNGLK